MQLRWLSAQISANRDRPVLALAGHWHTDAVEDASAGDRRFVQVRTAIFARAGDGGRIIRLLEDRMEVCATGARGPIH